MMNSCLAWTRAQQGFSTKGQVVNCVQPCGTVSVTTAGPAVVAQKAAIATQDGMGVAVCQ